MLIFRHKLIVYLLKFSQLAFHTLNSSRSAYQSITFKTDLFDLYTISGDQVQCSVLLKVSNHYNFARAVLHICVIISNLTFRPFVLF